MELKQLAEEVFALCRYVAPARRLKELKGQCGEYPPQLVQANLARAKTLPQEDNEACGIGAAIAASKV